jgi:hypothetical protein
MGAIADVRATVVSLPAARDRLSNLWTPAAVAQRDLRHLFSGRDLGLVWRDFADVAEDQFVAPSGLIELQHPPAAAS